MPIDSLCAQCGKTLRVGDEFEGRQARCPVCQHVYEVQRQSPLQNSSEVFGTPYTSASTPAETTYQPLPIGSTPSLPESTLAPVTTQNVALSSNASSEIPSETFYVRTPNSATYGPADRDTILSWIEQGRLDDTCHVRSAASNDWKSIPEWRTLWISAIPSTPSIKSVGNPFSGNAQPGYQFGAGQIPGNQSAGYLKTGGGMIVLVLGLLSWVLCFTVIGGPICSTIALFMGFHELRNIREGRSDPSEKTPTVIGIVFAALCLATAMGLFLLAILGAVMDV